MAATTFITRDAETR